MAKSTEEMSGEIIQAAAEAIRNHEPFEEICDMFVDTNAYRKLVQDWFDPRTRLNLLQHAIVYKYPEVVEYLTNGKYMFTFRESGSEQVNSPLYLACKIGCVEIVRFFIQLALESEGENAVFCILRDPGIVTYPQQGSEIKHEKKTLFELSVESKNLDCSLYLNHWVMKCLSSSFSRNEFYANSGDSTVLHDACYLGSASFLRLLLENGHARLINVRKNGYHPLHIAALLHHAECMDVLLQHGARMSTVAGCKSLLHLVCAFKANAEYLVECTRVLIKHGIDVNSMDHNHNTALGYLAWEYGQRYTPNVFLKTHKYSLIQAKTYSSHEVTSNEDYKKEIFSCMELLLENGATTMVCRSDGKVDHTLVHTLLQNTGYPHSSCITRYPVYVYKVLQLFFAYGADPNIVARSNNVSAFAWFLVHTLKEISSVEMKCHFLHLFIINGARLNCVLQQPKQMYLDNYLHRMWNMYPVLVALQEMHPMALIRIMYSYMSLQHTYHSFDQSEERYLWYRITTGLNFGQRKPEGEQYREEWRELSYELAKPRALKHLCKVKILSELGFMGRRVLYLPLPLPLKEYLVSIDC